MNKNADKNRNALATITLAISTPVIETTVKADEEHMEAAAIVGFTRFTRDESHIVWRFLQALAMTAEPLTKTAVKKSLKSIPQLADFVNAGKYTERTLMLAVTQHVRELGLTIDGNSEQVDTRTTKGVELEDVVEMLLQHTSFYEPFVAGFMATLRVLSVPTSTIAEDEAKN